MKVVSLLPGIDSPKDPDHYKAGANNTLLGPDPTWNPWERQLGIRFYGVGTDEIHRRVWEDDVPPYLPNYFWNTKRFRKINLNETAADYYLLEALASMSYLNDHLPEPRIKTYSSRSGLWKLWQDYGNRALPADRGHAEAIAVQASIMLEQMCKTLAPHFSDYLFYACGGELGHHPGTWYLGTHGEQNVSFWYMKDIAGPENVARWMKEMYMEEIKHKFGAGQWIFPNPRDHDQKYWEKSKKKLTNCWGQTSFGGEAWGDCASVLESYHRGYIGKMKFDDRQFLDRCFNLQHNTGSALNKCDWKYNSSWGVLNCILKAHGDSQWSVLYAHASENVKFLTRKYLEGVNRLREVDDMVSVVVDLEPTIPSWIEEKTAQQTGVCKVSGKKIKVGQYILTHGKGASLESPYIELCNVYGFNYEQMQAGHMDNPNGANK